MTRYRANHHDGFFLVIQLDPDNAFNDVNLANNIFATTAAITVS